MGNISWAMWIASESIISFHRILSYGIHGENDYTNATSRFFTSRSDRHFFHLAEMLKWISRAAAISCNNLLTTVVYSRSDSGKPNQCHQSKRLGLFWEQNFIFAQPYATAFGISRPEMHFNVRAIVRVVFFPAFVFIIAFSYFDKPQDCSSASATHSPHRKLLQCWN